MAHFNFVISQNAKWGHAGFYIDCHRMTVPEDILLQKKHWAHCTGLAKVDFKFLKHLKSEKARNLGGGLRFKKCSQFLVRKTVS